jgi:hypothetical protein
MCSRALNLTHLLTRLGALTEGEGQLPCGDKADTNGDISNMA